MARLHLIIGPVGAGKSTFAAGLSQRHQAVRLTLDAWMAVLFGDDERSVDGRMDWYMERTDRCLEQIWQVTQSVMDLGTDVVLEVGLIQRAPRQAFYGRVDASAYDLIATRDPIARPAPRFFLGRSAQGNVWATRCDLDPDLAGMLQALGAAEPRIAEPTPDAAPTCRDRVLELLSPVAVEYRGPCFALPEGLPSDPRARLIGPDERANWAESFPWLTGEFEAVTPVVMAFEGGQAAAICHSPRGQTERAAEAGVETLPEFRSCGLATATVTCWARAVQSGGKLALYSTSWENRASRAVARRLAGQLYGENWHVI
jgi:predicted kinase